MISILKQFQGLQILKTSPTTLSKWNNRDYTINKVEISENRQKSYNFTFNSLFVGRDGGALDADIMLENGVCCIDRHLVVGGIAVWQSQVEVQAIQL